MCEEERLYKEAVPYLLDWYDYNARVLPWRQEPTPYHVWVSEIMLQQTRVEAVRSYYTRFLAELPEVSDLAAVDEERLLKLWEGLGYYSRVRNMQKAAKVICEKYDGKVPREVDLLLELPGIGAYTAGAIASIAYCKPVPAVDGNVLRVMSRLTGSREDIAKESVKKRMTEQLRKVMPGERSGELNQAIMDIGATVCIPNGEPHCEDCPLMHLCRAYAEEATAEIPVKTGKKERKIVNRTILLLRNEGRILLHKRPESGLLAGLWEFPGVEEVLGPEEVAEAVKAVLGVAVLSVEKGPNAKHIFSHVEWHMTSYLVDVCVNMVAAERKVHLPEGYVWAKPKEVEEVYSVPGAFAKYREWVRKHV